MIGAIKTATPLTEDVAVITAHQLQALVLVDQLRVTLQAIERFDAQIATIALTLPDYALFRALPGAGPSLAPRRLAAFGEQRERFAGAHELYRCWQTRTPYDESTYLNALKRRGSPLLKAIGARTQKTLDGVPQGVKQPLTVSPDLPIDCGIANSTETLDDQPQLPALNRALCGQFGRCGK